MSGSKLDEDLLKQDLGIMLPGHIWPGAGAEHPAGATKP
jgi:hypothetical protein